MQAFDERKITMELKAGDYDLSVPPGSFNTAQVRSLQMGAGSNLSLKLSGQPTGLPSLNPGELFSADPQRLTVTVTTPTRSVALDSFAKPLSVILSMDGHTTPEGVSTRLSYASPNTGAWQTLTGQYSFTDNTLRGPLARPGSFAGITRGTPEAVVPAFVDESYEAMQRVTSRLTITDMPAYNSSDTVSSNRFNNLIGAVALNRETAELDGSLSAADRQSLTKAGLLTGGTLTREAAMNALVKLYEVKTKRILKPMTTAETLPGIEYASPALRNNLLKAADLGFITGELNPANPLTMGDLMTMLDILMGDAG
jgi:hypothetical protein